MKNHCFLLTTLLFCISSNCIFSQITVEDVPFEATATYNEKKLVLNGAGLREKLMIDLYVAGLYVDTKSTSGNTLASGNKAIALKMVIVSGIITNETMSNAVEEGFVKSTKGNITPLRSRINEFKAYFMQEQIYMDDEFEFVYTGGDATDIYKNGKKLGSIKGIDFKTALFKQWIGDDPVDEELKTELLKG